MSHQESHYVHGTHPAEQARLGILNEILNQRELLELNLRPGDRVLEMGAGTGICARAMARAVGPDGRVVAVERSEEQLMTALRQSVELGELGLLDLREGDALKPPLEPEEWGSFDLAHCRFLLEHLPDPAAVVRTLVRTVRPGGRIVLADDDHELLRLWPEPEGFQDLWRIYWRTYEARGNDPLVGRKLVQLLHGAGAQPTRNTYVFFGACAGHELFPAVVENMARVVESAREVVLAGGQIDRASFDRVLVNFRQWGTRDDAALWYGVSWAEGVRPLTDR